MIRNARVGDRVVVLDGWGKPITAGHMKLKIKDRPWTSWEFAKGNTGTVTEIKLKSGRTSWVLVKADSPNTGIHTFKAAKLRRIKEGGSE